MSHTMQGLAAEPVRGALLGQVGYLTALEQRRVENPGPEEIGVDRDPRDGFVETRTADGHYLQAIYSRPAWSEGRFQVWNRELGEKGELIRVSQATVERNEVRQTEYFQDETGHFVGQQSTPDGWGRLDVQVVSGDEAAAGAKVLGGIFDQAWWMAR